MVPLQLSQNFYFKFIVIYLLQKLLFSLLGVFLLHPHLLHNYYFKHEVHYYYHNGGDHLINQNFENHHQIIFLLNHESLHSYAKSHLYDEMLYKFFISEIIPAIKDLLS